MSISQSSRRRACKHRRTRGHLPLIRVRPLFGLRTLLLPKPMPFRSTRLRGGGRRRPRQSAMGPKLMVVVEHDEGVGQVAIDKICPAREWVVQRAADFVRRLDNALHTSNADAGVIDAGERPAGGQRE